MQYPTLLEYMKAIQDAGVNLDKLTHLSAYLMVTENPVTSVVILPWYSRCRTRLPGNVMLLSVLRKLRKDVLMRLPTVVL